MTITETNSTQVTEQIISQLLTMWHSRNTIVTNFFNKYNDEAYMNEVAPGRNRAVYLLGHLTATNDGMIPILGFGERLFPELEQIFSSSPDKTISEIPSVADLKQKWEAVNTRLSERLKAMSPSDWLGRHMSVSEEDFVKEPHRNKLSILIGRTNHQSYHFGQLNLLTVNEVVA